MTYFQAVEIKMDLIVNMQYSGVFKKEAAEALKETASKYTDEQLAEALCAIKQHYRQEYEDDKKLFAYAVSSKKWDTTKIKEEKKNA